MEEGKRIIKNNNDEAHNFIHGGFLVPHAPARRDELETDTIRVTICHVFAVRRDCSAQDTILKRVGCELPQLRLGLWIGRKAMHSGKPRDYARDQERNNSSHR